MAALFEEVASFRPDGPKPLEISADLRRSLAPATHCLYEWTDYWIDCPAADSLLVGSSRQKPALGSWFQLRFENHLGLAEIQPFSGSLSLCRPGCFEVISPKFPTPAQHVAFLQALLQDLFAQMARLPFDLCGPTRRGAITSTRPPNPLFALYFLCQHAAALEAAMAVLQMDPHRQLRDEAHLVSPSEVAEVNAEMLIGMMQAKHSRRSSGASTDVIPDKVWHRRPVESVDTPENRFALAFLRDLISAAEVLPQQTWWSQVPQERRRTVRSLSAQLRHMLRNPIFEDVGPMQRFPFASQVLMRRDGYRQFLTLWNVFHRALRPLFAPLQQALDLRDVARLYELWVYFSLADQIASAHHGPLELTLRLADDDRQWHAEAQFANLGRLVYHPDFGGASYSISVRPDFAWFSSDGKVIVLDAKFRLGPSGDVGSADVYKMHAYRDALEAQAAVAVYPGLASHFWDCRGFHRDPFTIHDLLFSDFQGVGALALGSHAPTLGQTV